MADKILFRKEAELFAANIVHLALIQLGKAKQNGGFDVESKGFELSGTEERGSCTGLLHLAFGIHPFVRATCRLTCVDGKWQVGIVDIRLLDTAQTEEKSEWQFCGRLTAEHKLEVYDLEG